MAAPLEETFYTVSVNAAEMWREVGRVLERRRLDRRWKPIDVERAGGPSYKTVQAIETGDIGHVESLDKCAEALGISIVDILHAVLAASAAPLSPEAAHVVRAFVETDVKGRQAMLALADAVVRVPGAAVTPATPRPPRPGPREVKRRNGR